MYQNLENKNLVAGYELSNEFIKRSIFTFHEACDYVWKLPYGRTTDRANWRLVLGEGKGTCSTKHALLKDLADEINVAVDLVVGIYAMTEKNTPGIRSALSEYGLDHVPEAHCYLKSCGLNVDLTRHDANAQEETYEFMIEKVIRPEDIGYEKQEFHKAFIKHEYGESELNRFWMAREKCIMALSS